MKFVRGFKKEGRSEYTHPNKMANSSSDLSSFMPEHELVELLWENGQIMMQGQSTRAKKSSFFSSESGFSGRVEEKGFGLNGALDSPAAAAAAAAAVDELPQSVPRAVNSHEDDADQWLSYAMGDDSLQPDYCSEFFSAVMTSLSNSNATLNPADKNTSFGQLTAKDSHAFKPSPVASEPIKNRAAHCPILSENPKTRPASLHKSAAAGGGGGGGGAGLINFSHFSRPASLVKSNPHSIHRPHEIDSSVSTLIDSSVSNTKPCSSSQCQNSSFEASMNMERNESNRAAETIVASSDGIVHISKKRTREREESGEHSDDLEEESFGVKEPSSGRGASGKRSRAAEVHNLSERRRRDRINEKMRALQELIPNCNKVDKASMLDEAIEYLKTLQLQVQMMSMGGGGLCMAPMMLQTGMNMQHLRAPQVSPFLPLGVGMGLGMGMGMGLGFGMGMIDLNCSPGIIPVPPMQFPCPSVPGGVSGIYRMPASSSAIHSVGIPAQRLAVPIPHSPFLHSQPGLPSQRTSMNPLQGSDTEPSASHSQPQQCLNLETRGKASQV